MKKLTAWKLRRAFRKAGRRLRSEWKKVVTVIVEGPSDENAIGGILKEFFSSEEVQFAVVHGDITSNYSTTKENVVSK